jgi:hypothetical protein
MNDLQNILVLDNGEPLVDLMKEICQYRRTDSMLNKILVRHSIKVKLERIQKILKTKSMKLMVTKKKPWKAPT